MRENCQSGRNPMKGIHRTPVSEGIIQSRTGESEPAAASNAKKESKPQEEQVAYRMRVGWGSWLAGVHADSRRARFDGLANRLTKILGEIRKLKIA